MPSIRQTSSQVVLVQIEDLSSDSSKGLTSRHASASWIHDLDSDCALLEDHRVSFGIPLPYPHAQLRVGCWNSELENALENKGYVNREAKRKQRRTSDLMRDV